MSPFSQVWSFRFSESEDEAFLIYHVASCNHMLKDHMALAMGALTSKLPLCPVLWYMSNESEHF